VSMSMEESAGEWFSSLPKTGGIYDLVKETTDENSQKDRIRAVIALGESGDPRAVRPLVNCCSDDNPDIRGYAIEGLEKLKSGRAVDALMDRLKDEDEDQAIRLRAVSALAAIGSYSAIEGLKICRSGEEDPKIRSCITEVLGKIHS